MIGVILAGGLSSRMGRDKATLTIAGTTLLEFMQAKMHSVGFDDIVVCRNAVNCLADTIPELGPLGALYTLSRHYPGRQVLIIPVDMPLLSSTTLQTLQMSASHAKVPVTLGVQTFPLYIPFEPDIIEALKRRVIQRDDLSIAAFLRDSGARQLVAIDDTAQFLNANTPQQWQAILTRLNTQSEPIHK